MTAPLTGCPTWPEEFARRYRETGYWHGYAAGGGTSWSSP
jgi:2,3-dihydroxybenzoate-AMP ligase